MSRPRTYQGHRVRSQLGFTSILERSYQGDIKEVVITHKERLYCFISELVKCIFVKHDTKVVVLGSDINVDDTESSDLPRTNYQSLLSSQQNTIGSGQPRIENDEGRLKHERFRYPTPKEREKLRKWT
ncbi:14974_t:CDS:1 [Funneliformis caledonium]|uniref:14974_t:CDS:1 n=1 Tax=Funneliformis caledonium TaxID=1117310 RepID=A0A9N9F0T5_9GLOM|nr:14974_t:CDS:1 [Funneliformis caledonium]